VRTIKDILNEQTTKVDEYDKSKEWIGVDLDGTLAYYESGYCRANKIGYPIPTMAERVHKWIAEGKIVKIFTARVSVKENKKETTQLIKNWLIENGFPELEITCSKDIFMTELWDDRVVKVEKNTGRILA
jgi:hypothetical protein